MIKKRETIRIGPVPENLMKTMEEKRSELIANLADIDDEIGELFLEEKEPSPEQLRVYSNLFWKKTFPFFFLKKKQK